MFDINTKPYRDLVLVANAISLFDFGILSVRLLTRDPHIGRRGRVMDVNE